MNNRNNTFFFIIIGILVNFMNSPIFSQPINLPSPQKTGGMPIMDAINHRRSIRSFSQQDISLESLSTLLWAANGINRPDSGQRTAPAINNIQNIDIYVARADGLYLYDVQNNQLDLYQEKDVRSIAGQLANVHFIYVANLSDNIENIDLLSAAHTGFIGQNVYLCCASLGLGTVIQSSINKTYLKNLMNLNADQSIVLVQSIGYPSSPSFLNAQINEIKNYIKGRLRAITSKKNSQRDLSQAIGLPEPQKTGGLPLMDAFTQRKSTYSLNDKVLPIQTLSDLLWAAFGVNRPSMGYRTAPSAYNTQNIDIYIAEKDGVHMYDAFENRMQYVSGDDIRNHICEQPSIQKAPVILIYVGNKSSQLDDFYFYSYAHTGFIGQNVYMFCSSNNLATAILDSIDRTGLHGLLNLTADQEVTMVQPVGFTDLPINESDSLTLVSFYQSMQGPEWNNASNWLESRVSEWYGITESDGYVTDIDLNHNNLKGILSPEIGNLNKLEYLNLSYNDLSDSVPYSINQCSSLKQLLLSGNRLIKLPTFNSNLDLNLLKIDYNCLTFESIENKMFIPNFTYSPQDSLGAAQDTIIHENMRLLLSINVDGTANQYQWTKNGELIPEATDDSLIIQSISLSDSGSYACTITNTIATELTLFSRPISVTIIPDQPDHIFKNIPEHFDISSNFPNPFNATTSFYYSTPRKSHITMDIYNSLGQIITTLISEEKTSGYHKIQWNASQYPAGIYLYRFYTTHNRDYRKTGKMILLK